MRFLDFFKKPKQDASEDPEVTKIAEILCAAYATTIGTPISADEPLSKDSSFYLIDLMEILMQVEMALGFNFEEALKSRMEITLSSTPRQIAKLIADIKRSSEA